MRIGFITQEYPPFSQGGAGTYAEMIVKNLARLGHEIVVFAPLKKSSGIAFEGTERIRVVPIPIPRTPFSMAFFWLRLRKAVLKEENRSPLDIIHVNSVTHWFPGKKRITGAPQILTIHHLSQDDAMVSGSKLCTMLLGRGENNPLVRRFEGQCVRSSDRTITVSEDTRRKLETRYGQRDKIVTIYEGTDRSLPQALIDPYHWREELNLGQEKVLLFVGRMNDPRKGLDLLLKAFSMKPYNNSCILIIVGQGDPGPIEEMATDLGIANRVKMLGFVSSSQLWELYNLCDLFVVPSRLEGFGLTVLDAAAAGKRVVATRVGAIPEISGPGTILVEPGDPCALAEGINQALTTTGPPEQLIREHAARYDWFQAARATERVYLEIMKQRVR